MSDAVKAGDRLKVVKGCKAWGLSKGITVYIDDLIRLSSDYSFAVKLVLKPLNGFKAGQLIAFYARHPNRLSDPIIHLNDGRPEHTLHLSRKE